MPYSRTIFTDRILLSNYLVVGAGNTLVGNVIFWLMWHLFGQDISFLTASILSFLLSVLFSFLTHSLLVFRIRDNWTMRLVRFGTAQLLSLAALTTTGQLLANVIRLDVHFSYLISSLVVVLIGMQINHKWVFSG